MPLPDQLQALHLHDNDQHDDSHAIPFSMKIDFDKVVRALKAVDYQGYFTLEADTPSDWKEPRPSGSGRQRDGAAARKLADMFDSL